MSKVEPQDKVLTAVGLMSGTSLDGIDVAILRTDGTAIHQLGPATTAPYGRQFRDALMALLGCEDRGQLADIERQLTLRHAGAVLALLGKTGLAAADIDVIGFHGHTMSHRPQAGVSVQIGDGALLAEETGIAVVNDFRANDIVHGGEGAPLAPLYHAALADGLERPLCVLNVGGVGNLTWLGDGGAVMAFDTGPGNALLDDWAAMHGDQPMDEGGRMAARGQVSAAALARLVDHGYFALSPPKSLDRGAFSLDAVAGLSAADGAATLTAFTALAVSRGVGHLPQPPVRWLVTGGGRHNPSVMAALRGMLEAPVEPVEAVGWQGDAIEAQAFAFLAVRSLKAMVLSLPGTTGVAEAVTGGVLNPGCKPPRKEAGW